MKIDKSKWAKVKLGDIAQEISERAENPSEFERFVGLEHLVSGDTKVRNWKSTDNLVSSMKKFQSGDILFARRNTYLKRASLVDFNGVCSGDAFVIRVDKDRAVNDILAFLVNSSNLWDYSNKHAAGSLNGKRVKWRDLANYEFLLPPKEEQAHLAELLWAADEVVEREKEVVRQLEILQKVYLQTKFEDATQPVISFADLLEINPRMPKPVNKEMLVSFITMADVSNEGVILNKENRILRELEGNGFTPFIENDILFAKITPCMENGKGAIAQNLTNKIGLGSTEFHVLRTKDAGDIKFCFYLSKMKSFRKIAERLMTGSAGQKRVQAEFFEYYKFHAPKLKDRICIGEQMDQIENRKQEMRRQVDASQQLKSVLINKIF